MADEDFRAASDAPLFDAEHFLERIDGDRALFNEVIGIFIEDAPTLISDIGDGIERGEPRAAQKAAHALKGAAGNISAKRLQDLAHRLERVCGRRDLNTAGELYGRLKEVYRQLNRILTSHLAGQA